MMISDPAFLSRIEIQPNGCWLWTGATGGSGVHLYGVFRGTTVHRWAYEQIMGPIPNGLVLDHVVCQQKMCANPAHVEPVTQAENLRRSKLTLNSRNAAKTECLKGHPFDERNTYVSKTNGQRVCRACRRDLARKYRSRTT